MATTLGNAVEFLRDLGLFDVVLPFLLVFSIVFAILEKTQLLGKEDKTKNVNSIVALSIALITIAANEVVTAITTALPNIVLLLVISLSFLVQLGLFIGSGEMNFSDKHKGWYKFFVAALFIGVVLIFSNSVETSSGESYLETAWNYLSDSVGEGVIAGVIFLALVGGVIYYIQRKPGNGNNEDEDI